MFLELLLLLFILVIGYLIPPLNARIEKGINRVLGVEILIILLLMGASLAGMPNLASQLGKMWWQMIVLTGLILVFNLVALWFFFMRASRKGNKEDPITTQPSSQSLTSEEHEALANASEDPMTSSADENANDLLGSLKSAIWPISMVIGGIVLGILIPSISHHAGSAVTLLLYLLLLLIGHQLRDAEISLSQLIANPVGIKASIIVVISSLAAGVCSIPFLHTSLAASLALSSGFGWYSLSSVMMNNMMGPYYGGLALCNDFAREILSILLMPLLFRKSGVIAVSYCGATAMDVMLPLIRKHGGVVSIPLALTSGFILSLMCPLLIMIFASFAH